MSADPLDVIDWHEEHPRFNAARRRQVFERYAAIIDRLGKPMSRYEMSAAIGNDSRTDLNEEPFRETPRGMRGAAYDRRGLLNVISALLDEIEPPPPSRPRGVVVIGLLLLALAAAGIVVWRGL
jgi:hypothetical protein